MESAAQERGLGQMYKCVYEALGMNEMLKEKVQNERR